jgi:DNA-binding MarR family transcriptional regulator
MEMTAIRVGNAIVSLVPRLARHITNRLEDGTPPLSIQQLYVLQRIAGGTTRSTALARRARVTGATMSKILDRLVAAEMVAREPDPTDRRASIVTLTFYGAELLRERSLKLQNDLESLFVDVSDAERDAIAHACAVIETSLDRRIEALV